MNPYKLLAVKETASMDEIKTAFKQAARKYHPDRGGSHFDMTQINAAYEQLQIAHRLQETDQDQINLKQKQIKIELTWRDRYWKMVGNAASMTAQDRAIWIAWVLDPIDPPKFIWELHAQESGYPPKWAEQKYLIQTRKKNARP